MQKILIIDFGSQVTQLIARRVRENNIYSKIVPFNISEKEFDKITDIKAIILSGSPKSVTEKNSPKPPKKIFKMNIPILGICYGQHIMCTQLGGIVKKTNKREFGRTNLLIVHSNKLFDGIGAKGNTEIVWMSHGDSIFKLPNNFNVIGVSKNAPYAVIADEFHHFYGVQFHPEVIHTKCGEKLIRNFIINIAKCTNRNWSMTNFKTKAIANIKKQVGDKKVICGVSGGIDSSVVAILLHKAIGKQLQCVFINNGMLRYNEAEEILSMFRDNYDINLSYINASKLFLDNLIGISDPEQKRKIIGSTFIKIFENEAKKKNNINFLAQGTIYSDVIESFNFIGNSSSTIKSHHNVGGLPVCMNMSLIEPIRELFKDEVRNLGIELGLNNYFIKRHPFPGPGFAIRILSCITNNKLQILRKADSIYIEEINNANLYDDIWQAFVILLPVRTVGVMGDKRTYNFACVLRAITSVDGMTADYYPFKYSFLNRVASRIINEVDGINRVTYDITSKPPGTIEWE